MPAATSGGKPENFFKTMKRLFGYFRGRRWLICLVVVLVIYSSLANILGTYISGVVVINGLIEDPNSSTLVNQVLMLGGIYLAGVIANFIYCQSMVRITQYVIYKVRMDLVKKIQELPIAYYDTHTHGEIMSYFTNDIETLFMALNDSFANIVLSFANIVGTIVMLFIINVPLTLIVIFFIILMFVYMFLNSKRAQKFFKVQQKALADVNSVVEEELSGMKVEKAFNHEEESYKKFTAANTNWRNAAENAFFCTQMNIPFFVSLSYFNFSISAVVGIIFLCNGYLGAAGFGGLTSYLVYVRQSAQPFNFFTMHLNAILSAAAGAERIFKFLDEKVEEDAGYVSLVKVSDADTFENRYAWSYQDENGKSIDIPLRGVIKFDDVCFSYVPGKPILKHISFEAYPGKKVAFVGSTGAGKTTIISLLARFYPIDSGAITYDGIDIRNIKLESLRRAISMVTQDTHLFSGTIADNIRYVRWHSTKEEILAASKNSHADSFIRKLPQGYETVLHDDGANLSEGQRQLLGLTRASLNKPPVMILDEATSNIDTRSEVLIHKGLESLMKQRTVLVIAHRLSTIKDADEIIVLDSGSIIERGTQTELLAKKGAYYDLYTGKRELQ